MQWNVPEKYEVNCCEQNIDDTLSIVYERMQSNEFVVENHSRCYSAILLSLFIFGNVNFASQIFRNSWYTKTVCRYPVYQTQSIIINIRRSQRTLNIVQSRAFHTHKHTDPYKYLCDTITTKWSVFCTSNWRHCKRVESTLFAVIGQNCAS